GLSCAAKIAEHGAAVGGLLAHPSGPLGGARRLGLTRLAMPQEVGPLQDPNQQVVAVAQAQQGPSGQGDLRTTNQFVEFLGVLESNFSTATRSTTKSTSRSSRLMPVSLGSGTLSA